MPTVMKRRLPMSIAICCIWKPVAVTRSVYTPGARPSKWNRSVELMADLLMFACRWLSVICAPTMGSPCASTTVPSTRRSAVCAETDPDMMPNKIQTAMTALRRMYKLPERSGWFGK